MTAILLVPCHQLARDHRWSTTSNGIARVKIADDRLTTPKMSAIDGRCPHANPLDDHSIAILRSYRPPQTLPTAIHSGVKSP